jgi:hypothetical protein
VTWECKEPGYHIHYTTYGSTRVPTTGAVFNADKTEQGRRPWFGEFYGRTVVEDASFREAKKVVEEAWRKHRKKKGHRKSFRELFIR